ncbi:prolyl-tRNA synthetase associated domain-containing protein [Candidatus Babeliales bacterium]|nr:prolyl-tRNA synthetase associated domain-containing protein [Candidatus Babeliales bacterium]MBP9843701.1 prolyl-tRNA synthetase associated domain-containing protein [Candidatus Babeliales bacterium]
MHFTQQQLLEYLDSHKISYHLYQHPPLFTCEQGLAIVADMNIPGMGIKNLFLKDSKKNLYLISATFKTRIDLKTTGKALNAKELRFADAELLEHHLGVQPGSVTPLALINDQDNSVQAILDASIFEQNFIQIHPLKNDATVVITPTDLINFLGFINKSYAVYDFTTNQIV